MRRMQWLSHRLLQRRVSGEMRRISVCRTLREARDVDLAWRCRNPQQYSHAALDDFLGLSSATVRRWLKERVDE